MEAWECRRIWGTAAEKEVDGGELEERRSSQIVKARNFYAGDSETCMERSHDKRQKWLAMFD